jgi:hypothetical protein
MVLFFVWNRREKAVAQAQEILKGGDWYPHIVNERISMLSVHLIFHLPLLTFCAMTLAAPVFAFVSLRAIVMGCNYT